MSRSLNTTSQLLEENQQLRSSLVELKLTTRKDTVEFQAREERFALALKGANDGLWDWNLKTAGSQLSRLTSSLLSRGMNF